MNDLIPGVFMAAAIVSQAVDYMLTIKGLDRGMVEVGLINKHFIKSKADEGKLPLITFVEGAIVLALFGAFTVYGGNLAGAGFAGTVAVLEGLNDYRSYKLLSKK